MRDAGAPAPVPPVQANGVFYCRTLRCRGYAFVAKWGNKLERAEEAIKARVRKFAEHRIVGMDFNLELVKASKMSMVMNNDGTSSLFQANSLEAPATWDADLVARRLLGNGDILFANPPFGSKIPVTDPAILENYNLGRSRRMLKACICRKRNFSPRASRPERACARASLTVSARRDNHLSFALIIRPARRTSFRW